MKYTCQKPTKRSTFWKNGPSIQIEAQSAKEAAAKLANKRGPGVWYVNVWNDEGNEHAAPWCLYASYKMLVEVVA
jgi:hypothetical protein